MEEENKHIDELIANYLTEGLDKNALDELKTWIAASAENQQYFIRQREIWFSAVSREAASVYDKDKAFENFRNRVESQKEIQSTSRRGFSLSALWRYAAVVAIIIAVGCISYWQGEVNVKDTFADISVEAPLGSKTKLYLPDGTLVWLNAGSRMTYSQGFGVDNRKVELEGEGYFEVKRNEKIPFFVKTKDLQLQVLGTKFNIKAYNDESDITTTLNQGHVRVSDIQGRALELFPGEQIVYEKKNGTMHKRTLENVADYSGWKTNSLYFTDTRLDHISKELSRKFNKEIVLMDPSLESSIYTISFNNMPLDSILEDLTRISPVRYEKINDKILIYKRK